MQKFIYNFMECEMEWNGTKWNGLVIVAGLHVGTYKTYSCEREPLLL